MKLTSQNVLVLLSAYLLFYVYMLKVTWATTFNWTLYQVIHNFTNFFGPLFILIICSVKDRNSSLQLFFNWKIWLAPITTFLIFSVVNWLQSNPLSYTTSESSYYSIFGYRWEWSAPIYWAFLLLLQLVLYQKRGVHNFDAFALSFFGVCVASVVWELPWNLRWMRWDWVFDTKFAFCLGAMGLLLREYEWKVTKPILVGLVPLVLSWLFFFNMPYWMPRLTSTLLFFVMLPGGISKPWNCS